jgi:hypothetical protein
MADALEALTVLPATAVSPRAGPTVRAAAPAAASTAIEVEPILTPQRPRTAATRVRPPTAPPPVSAEEEPSRSSSGALVGSALVILAVVGAIAWRSSTRARVVPPVTVPAVEAPAVGAPAAVDAAGPMVAPAATDSDAHIQNEIQRLLVSSSQLRSQPIVVEVANGIVTLSGSVPDAVSSQLAESFASSVGGVRRVFNTLRVPPPAAGIAAAPPPAAPPPAASETAEDATRRPPRDDGERDREGTRELMEKAKREMAAGRPGAALEACQAVLRIDPMHPHARECVERLGNRPGGPPRRQ